MIRITRPEKHVGAVEAGEHEEGLPELGRAPGVAGEAGPVVDEVAPLVGLAAEEGRRRRRW